MHVNPIVRDWFFDMWDLWKGERQWDTQRYLSEVRRLCPGMFDGINHGGDSHPVKGRRAQSRTFATRTRLGQLGGVACARSDDDFREAVAKADELYTTGDLFVKQIEPEPAPEDPVEWAMTEGPDDEDDSTPAHADAEVSDEPQRTDFPPAPPSAPCMSNLERCIALRMVYGVGFH